MVWTSPIIININEFENDIGGTPNVINGASSDGGSITSIKMLKYLKRDQYIRIDSERIVSGHKRG